MTTTPILHPQILSALARAGHSSKILIADGNYPVHTRRGPNAEIVHLNFSPGKLTVTEVLIGIAKTVPLELAEVMAPEPSGPYALKSDPPTFKEFRKILKASGAPQNLAKLERFDFYDAAGGRDVVLAVATGDQQMYANILLTIGVIRGVIRIGRV